MKKSAKYRASRLRTCLGDTEPPSKHKMYSYHIFADWFVEKEGGLRTHNPSAEEEGGLEAFLYLTDQNFELG
jgi:hypothetical protein